MKKVFPYNRITADDWGMSPAVNEGILQLVEKGIVRRVSLLSDAPYVKTKLPELLSHSVELGLHFDLTLKNRSTSVNPFCADTLFAYLIDLRKTGKEKKEAFKKECLRQLAHLKAAGISVSYLDGHQHVHLLPFVSEGVAEALFETGIKTIRNPYSTRLWVTKKSAINVMSLLGVHSYKKRGIDSTSCLYPLKKAFESTETLNQFLKKSPESEFIVHPATRNDFNEVGCEDPYREERVREFKTLLGLKELQEW